MKNRIALLSEGIDLCYQLTDAMEKQDMERARKVNVAINKTHDMLRAKRDKVYSDGPFSTIQGKILSYDHNLQEHRNGYLSHWRMEIDKKKGELGLLD